MMPIARTVPDTDWHLERLYDFADALGASVLAATHSRYVVDLNRDPQGALLYPGADNSELCPLRTFASQPIYQPGQEPTPTEQSERLARYFVPYHARLQSELLALQQRFGYVILLDGHSIRSEVPRFFAGRLPDLNLGSSDGSCAAAALIETAWSALGRSPSFSRVHNGRFRGGYVTRHYGRPAEGIHTLQLELAQSCYLDENQPAQYDAERAVGLVAALRLLIEALLRWPGR
jgi:N-formylglutamate amidohydrolase